MYNSYLLDLWLTVKSHTRVGERQSYLFFVVLELNNQDDVEKTKQSVYIWGAAT